MDTQQPSLLLSRFEQTSLTMAVAGPRRVAPAGPAMAFLVTGAGTSIGAITGAFVIARARVIGLVVALLFAGGADLIVGHGGEREGVSTSPPRVDLAIGGDRYTRPHVESLLLGTGVLAARLRRCPDPARTRYADSAT